MERITPDVHVPGEECCMGQPWPFPGAGADGLFHPAARVADAVGYFSDPPAAQVGGVLCEQAVEVPVEGANAILEADQDHPQSRLWPWHNRHRSRLPGARTREDGLDRGPASVRSGASSKDGQDRRMIPHPAASASSQRGLSSLRASSAQETNVIVKIEWRAACWRTRHLFQLCCFLAPRPSYSMASGRNRRCRGAMQSHRWCSFLPPCHLVLTGS